MRLDHIPHPNDWVRVNDKGNCFHQALSRWAHLRAHGDTRWKVAIAVVVPPYNNDRHIHAWLQAGDQCVMHDGNVAERTFYFQWMGVEVGTLRLLNPRSILRGLKAPINRDTIGALLDLWGQPYTTNAEGGVIPKE